LTTSSRKDVPVTAKNEIILVLELKNPRKRRINDANTTASMITWLSTVISSIY